MSLPLLKLWRTLAQALGASLVLAVPAHAADAGGSANGGMGWNAQTLESVAKVRGLEVRGLAHAWQLVQENDPVYQAAASGLRAAQTERAKGRSNLLPAVSAGFYRSRIRGEQVRLDVPTAMNRAELDYDSQTVYIQLQQPLLNYRRYAEYERGYALADSGEADFVVQEHQRFLEMAEAYFRTVLAYETLALDQSLVDSLKAQAAGQEALFQSAEGSRIDAQEVRTRLALAEADVIRDRDELETALRELQSMLGRVPNQIAGLGKDFQPLPLEPQGLAQWLELAQTGNAELRAARMRLRVADANVSRAKARHLPELDLIAGWSKADSENLDTLSQNTNTFTVGVNLAIPIFSGGYDTATNARARAEQRQAAEELKATLQKVEAEVVRHHTGVTGGAMRIAALEAAEESSRGALEAARAAYQYGQVSNLDVLKQQDTLYRTRHELARTRIGYTLSLLQLWTAAGVTNNEQLQHLDTALTAAISPRN